MAVGEISRKSEENSASSHLYVAIVWKKNEPQVGERARKTDCENVDGEKQGRNAQQRRKLVTVASEGRNKASGVVEWQLAGTMGRGVVGVVIQQGRPASQSNLPS